MRATFGPFSGSVDTEESPALGSTWVISRLPEPGEVVTSDMSAGAQRIRGIPPIEAITDLRKWEVSREKGWLTAGNGADVIEDLLAVMVKLVGAIRKGHQLRDGGCTCGAQYKYGITKKEAKRRHQNHLHSMTGGW